MFATVHEKIWAVCVTAPHHWLKISRHRLKEEYDRLLEDAFRHYGPSMDVVECPQCHRAGLRLEDSSEVLW